MATGPGVSIRIERKQFGAAGPLFEDFALDIPGGSVVAITGPSGIGKSTLLRMIAGIDRDFHGHIEVGGRLAHLAPASGFVPQDARLLPWLTTRGNLRAVAPALSGAEVDALLVRVGLDGTGDLFPYQLSGGMQRRVALARALAANPSLLLLDEPFVSLDRTLADEMIALLGDVVAAARPTVILVSHVLDDAAGPAEKVVVLHGRPARIATPTEPVLTSVDRPAPGGDRVERQSAELARST